MSLCAMIFVTTRDSSSKLDSPLAAPKIEGVMEVHYDREAVETE